MANIIQWLQQLNLRRDECSTAEGKQEAGPELKKRRRRKYTRKSKDDNPSIKTNDKIENHNSTVKESTHRSSQPKSRIPNGQANQTNLEKHQENSSRNSKARRRTSNRPSFNREWIIKPVDTIIRLPMKLEVFDPITDCPICQQQFRSERMFRSHVAVSHGSCFKLDPLLDFDPRNHRIDRQVCKLAMQQLPMSVPTFSITVENLASVPILLNSIYIFDGNVQLWPVFAGGQILRMVPGYCFEDEVTLDDMVLVEGRSYSLIITATPVGSDRLLNRQVVEQYHFTEKVANNKGKKTQIALTKLPPYDIPRPVTILYKSNYKDNGLYTSQERDLMRLIEVSKQDNLLSLDRYSKQLTVLNQIEAQHMLQEYFNYTILEPVIVPQNNTRLYTVSTSQFKKKPSLLNEDVKAIFISQGATRMEKAYGVVEKITADMVTFRMQEFVDATKVVKIMFMLNRTTFQLERKALTLMSATLIKSICLPEAVTGGPLESFASFQWIRQNVASNAEQVVAIRNIVNQTSFPAPYILFGPPGTGKTSTLVEAIGQIYKLRPTVNILVAATSNYAANELTSRLLDCIPDEDVFRFFAYSSLKKINEIEWDVLDVSNLAGHSYSNICYEDIYMCRVVVATLTTAGRLIQANIKSKHFSYVFIDECGSSKEITSLIPIAGLATNGNEINASVVLAGDPKQLGPVIQYDFLKQTSHGLSMLERLMNLPLYAKDQVTNKYNHKAIMVLRDNYRSNDRLIQFCNDLFYDGQLRSKASHEIKNFAVGWHRLPNSNCPLMFHPISSKTKQDKLTYSFFNAGEAKKVLFYVSDLLKNGLNGKPVNQSDIGILSFYARQVTFLRGLCTSNKWHDIEIGSAEQYQGREKPIMMISTVRSNCDNVGFLADAKRLNVALTRARSLMIVVGNTETLQQDPLWKKFLDYCRKNGAIVNRNRKTSSAVTTSDVNKISSPKTPKTKKRTKKLANDLFQTTTTPVATCDLQTEAIHRIIQKFVHSN